MTIYRWASACLLSMTCAATAAEFKTIEADLLASNRLFCMTGYDHKPIGVAWESVNIAAINRSRMATVFSATPSPGAFWKRRIRPPFTMAPNIAYWVNPQAPAMTIPPRVFNAWQAT